MARLRVVFVVLMLMGCAVAQWQANQRLTNDTADASAFSSLLRPPEAVLSRGSSPPTDLPGDTLHVDLEAYNNGVGLTAGGTFYTAARLTATAACTVATVIFYKWDMSSDDYLFVWGAGTTTQPGPLIESVPYSGSTTRAWQSIDLVVQVPLAPGEDIWVGPRMNHAAGTLPLGVDDGPSVPTRGDWVNYQGAWEELAPLGLDMNWHIRAVLGHGGVPAHDVGCTKIIAPTGVIDPGTLVTPACWVYNYGTTTESYNVRMKVGAVYDQSSSVSGHAPGDTVYVTFPTWIAVAGTYPVSCSTELAADLDNTNDKQTGSVIVTSGGGGWVARAPMPTVPSGKAVKDGGWLAYDKTMQLVYGAKGNKTGDFYAYFPLLDSWYPRALIPAGREGKPSYKGAVGFSDGDAVLYATKGNNTLGFWKYVCSVDSWYQMKDVPFGPFNKKVKGGTDLVVTSPDSAEYVYLLKGYKNEFYKYFPLADSWHRLPDAPVGQNMKWDKGSWLAYDLQHTIFAHKAKFHEFYSFNTLTDSWNPTPLRGMPLMGSGGRSKKSKDGGCATYHDSALYALKGGNTQEFWKYNVAGNFWFEKETLPKGVFRKKVKAGADITTRPLGGDRPGDAAELPALTGNKTNSFWVYPTPGGGGPPMGSAPNHDGVAAENRHPDEPLLMLAPNPLSGRFISLRYCLPGSGVASARVYDVTGRPVLSAALIADRAGTAQFDLRSLNAGVYLLKVEGSGFATVRKLVVER